MSVVDKIIANNRPPAKLRIAAVTFLASLLVGLYCYPFPPPDYEVTTIVSRPRRPDDQAGGLTEDARALLDERYLQRVKELQLLVSQNDMSQTLSVRSKELQPFRVAYSLSVRHSGESQSKKAATEFVRDFVDYQNRLLKKPAHQPAPGGSALVAAMRKEQAARADLTRFVKEEVPRWLDQQVRNLAKDSNTTSQEAKDKETNSNQSQTGDENPRWKSLQAQIQKVSDQLEELRQSKTDRHPSYQLTVMRMTELQRRLADTPRYQRDGGESQTTPADNGATTDRGTPAAHAVSDPTRELTLRFDQHLARIESAAEAHRLEHSNAVSAVRGLAGEWLIAGSPSIKRQPAPVEMRFLLTLLGISAGIGCTFALACSGLGRARFFAIQEVQSALPVPVAAVVPASAPAPSIHLAGRAAALKGVQRVAEWMLIVCAVTFLAVCLSASERLAEFAYDPVGVLVQTFRFYS